MRRAKASRPPQGQAFQEAHVPAPLGGTNTVAGASAMPATDAIYCYNLVAAEYGLRSRLGFREWCTNLSGTIDDSVRSILAFSGSTANGAGDALFATTETGIWTVTNASASPTQTVAFAETSGKAGWGVSHVASTVAGRFLLYCDEVNGYHVYAEGGGGWTVAAAGTTQLWEASTPYEVGNRVVNGGNMYQCDTNGTSAGSGGPTGTGSNIVDGSTRWDYVGAASATAIGPSLADQQNGITLDPADLVHVTVWKGRVWLVEASTSRAWYLEPGAIYGTATSFDFGSKMRAGGQLVGLYNWSYDGGSGMDTLLVGISGAGDVVIYQGTDPASASTFGLKGCWFVGGVPSGRNIATDYGGDLLILSQIGVVPLSRLVVGTPVESQDFQATAKIANLINGYVSERRSRDGWAVLIHPTDNALLVTVPTESGEPTIQFAQSLTGRRGWSQYRDLPLLSAGVWNGELYFGTTDGRVCWNTGYVDEVLLSDPNAYTPVSWSVLTAFQNLGNMRQKRVHMLRPSVLSQASTPRVRATALFDYNLTEPSAPTGATVASEGTWDGSTWDSSVWGGNVSASEPIQGSAGCGRAVAIAVRGDAVSRTILVGVDVVFEQGGVL